jgi:hypothetical protein
MNKILLHEKEDDSLSLRHLFGDGTDMLLIFYRDKSIAIDGIRLTRDEFVVLVGIVTAHRIEYGRNEQS